MMTAKKLFGTDGIRGRANQAPLDPETLLAIGCVLGRLIRERGGQGGVLFGDDGRLSAVLIRAALGAGLMAEGIDVHDAGLTTTPALAHETRLGSYSAGVMVSASHNPADDNGIKLFGHLGGKLPDELEERIEEEVAEFVAGERGRPGRAFRRRDMSSAYRSFLRERFASLDLGGMRIVIDCAHGGGSALAPKVLEDFGAEAIVCNNAPDGLNINDGCGALHPDAIADRVASEGATLGVCLDGDGDRSIFVDEKGQIVHGDALLAILGNALFARGDLPNNKLAATVMSNLGLRKALSQGIGIVETPVGDRSVSAAMKEHGLALGGENSGHVIFGPEHEFTGDGIYTCLKLVEILEQSKESLSSLAACFEAFPQKLINVRVREKPILDDIPAIVAARESAEQELGDEGRVVLRYSGTENLCRVMVEASNDALLERVLGALVSTVEDCLGA